MDVSMMVNGETENSTAGELLSRLTAPAKSAAGRTDVILSGLKIALKPETRLAKMIYG